MKERINEAAEALHVAQRWLKEMREAAQRGLSVATVERCAEHVDNKIQEALAKLGD